MVCVIKLKTTQTAHIRTLIDSLNALLTDVNITFYPYYIDSDESSTSDKKLGGVIIKELNKKMINI